MRDAASAVAAARAFVDGQFPEARAAVVAGSAARGAATPTSDLDVVVLLPGTEETAYKETFDAFGWTVEAFVVTRESCESLFASQPAMRVPAFPVMWRDGIVLRDRNGAAQAVRAQAHAVLERGPQPLTPAGLAQYRHAITEYRDDLAGAGSPDAYFFIAPALADKVADFVLAHHRQWGGDGKWRLNALRRFDDALAERLVAALDALYRAEEKGPLLELAEHVLRPVGGPLRAGFTTGKPAPAEQKP